MNQLSDQRLWKCTPVAIKLGRWRNHSHRRTTYPAWSSACYRCLPATAVAPGSTPQRSAQMSKRQSAFGMETHIFPVSKCRLAEHVLWKPDNNLTKSATHMGTFRGDNGTFLQILLRTDINSPKPFMKQHGRLHVPSFLGMIVPVRATVAHVGRRTTAFQYNDFVVRFPITASSCHIRSCICSFKKLSQNFPRAVLVQPGYGPMLVWAYS